MKNNIFNKIKIILSATLNENTKMQINAHRVFDSIVNKSFYGKYSNALDTYVDIGTLLFRGDENLEDYYSDEVGKWIDEIKAENKVADLDVVYKIVFELTPGKRKSENTGNFYTKLFSDVLESWKEFPKRNNSFICSTNYNTAVNYGANNIFCVFPENNVKIAICPKRDMWLSFKNSIGTDLDLFNNRFYRTLTAYIPEYLDMFEDAITQYDSNDKIFEIFAALEENIKRNKQVREQLDDDVIIVKNFIEPVINGEHLYDYFNRALDPIANGFELISSFDKIYNYDNNEVWFSGKCLAIDRNIIENIF